MSTANFVLDSTYSAFDKEHLEEWRAQVRSNEDWMREHLPVNGLSGEAVERAVQECCYSKRAAVAEFYVAGCKTYGFVKEDSNGSIDTSLFVVTPNAFYSGQSVTLYQSGRDPRFEELRTKMKYWAHENTKVTEDPEVAWKNAAEFLLQKEADLQETIWQEQVDLLFGMV